MFTKADKNLINSIICVGGAHTSGVKCVNNFTYADEDIRYKYLKGQPHPENKENAFWSHIAPVMQIGTLLISSPNWNNKDIILKTLEYVRRKAHPEDTIAIIGFESWGETTHKDVINFHTEMRTLGVLHLMFNTTEHLDIPEDQRYDFRDSYIDPYNPIGTMVSRLKAENFDFNPETEYFGQKAHKKWARILLKYLTKIA